MKRFIRFTLLILMCFFTMNVSAQSYCTPQSNSSTTPTSFRYHFLLISIGGINRSFPNPQSTQAKGYLDYTSKDSAVYVRGHTYPARFKMGNGANTQTVAVWIDYNKDKIFSTSERAYTFTDYANQGDHIHSAKISIPSNIPVGTTRMRVATSTGTSPPDPCVNNYRFHIIDFTVRIARPVIQRFVNSDLSHPTIESLTKGSKKQQLLRIKVNTNVTGTLSPLTADSFRFHILGCTDPKDITKAWLYYTGQSQWFVRPTMLDTSNGFPGNFFGLKADRKLEPGTNYFWLLVNISPGALLGNKIDAVCRSLDVVTTRYPKTLDPNGSREVSYCRSIGDKNLFIYIDEVKLNNINNNTGRNGGFYGDYTNITDTLEKGKKYQLSLRIGNSVNPTYEQVWIDLNRNGIFEDATERVFFDSLMASVSNATYGPVVDSILIPNSATTGKMRMRITSSYRPNYFPRSKLPKPCTNPLTIGEVEDYTLVVNKPGHPVAKFSTSNVCLGDTVKFIDQSYTTGSYKINSRKWYFGNGDSSGQQSPQYVYSNPGTYKVRLIVKTNLSSAPGSEITKIVKVESPQADFSVLGNLYKTPVRFTDQSKRARVTKWSWNFGDPASKNNTSSKQHPFHTFDTAQNYNVRLIVTSSAGCKDTVLKKVKIVKVLPPKAFFNTETDSPRAGQKLLFQDQSLYATHWKWLISPAFYTLHKNTADTSQNPVISLDSVRTYQVKLLVSNSRGKDSITKTFVTQQYLKPVAKFSQDKTNVVAGEAIQFIDNSQNFPVTWKWDFGDSSFSSDQFPVYNYKDTGVYDVQLTVGNPAGKDSLKKKKLVKVTSDYQMCGQSTKYSPLLNGKIFDSGGKNGSYKNNSNCGFLIKPFCSGKVTLNFNSFNFRSGDYLKVFDGTGPNGTPLHTGNGFTGSSNPGKFISKTGSFYMVEITNSSSTTTGFEATWSSSPNKAPTARIDADTLGYINSPFSLRGYSTTGINNNLKWDLDNDGTIDFSGISDTAVKYKQAKTFVVRLIVENCKGIDSAYDTVKIIKPSRVPAPDFSAQPEDTFLYGRVWLYDSTDFGPTSWRWEIRPDSVLDPSYGYLASIQFDFNTSYTSRNPVITFLYPGIYTVCLTAFNSQGKSKEVCKKQYIKVRDQVNMCTRQTSGAKFGVLYDDGGPGGNYGDGYNSGNRGVCTFTIEPCASSNLLKIEEFNLLPGDYLRVYDGPGAQVPLYNKRAFPDGFTGNKSNNALPRQVRARTGIFYIEFETNNNSNAQGFKLEWAANDVKANFSAPDVCDGTRVSFNNKSKTAIGDYGNYTWDLGDGTLENKYVPKDHLYKNPGTYQVKLNLKTTRGCKDSITKPVKVYPAPKAAFSAGDICFGDTVRFSQSSYVKNDSIRSYQWTFGDGDSSFIQTPVHYYDTAAKKEVELVVETKSACRDTARDSVEIHPLPEADIKIKGKCDRDTLAYISRSGVAKGNITGHLWNFGDGDTAMTSTAVHAYQNAGTYRVRYVATSGQGCQDTTFRQKFYNPWYSANFTAIDVCFGDTVRFTQLSDPGIDSVANYEWNFGDNKTVSAREPVHYYKAPDSFTVRLIMELFGGCRDTVWKNVNVHPRPEAEIYIADDAICLDDTLWVVDSSDINAGGKITARDWAFSDGQVFSNRVNFPVTFSKDGKFDVELKVISANACEDSAADSIWVLPLPESDFTFQMKEGGKVVFAPVDSTLPFYRWLMGNGDTVVEMAPEYRYDSNRNYLVTLQTKSNYGCSHLTTKTVTVSNIGAGIDDHEFEKQFRIYPNPAGERLYIRYLGTAGKMVGSSLVDIYGRVVRKEQLPFGVKREVSIDLRALAAGMYFLHLGNDQNLLIKPVIVEH